MKTEQLDLSYGSKSATLLLKEAQIFIIDNLDAIIAESQVIEENKGRPWTDETS